jgi:3-phytase
MQFTKAIVILFLGIAAAQAQVASAPASQETDPVPHAGDAADDPCIWMHPSDSALSTIIGTDKEGGIAVYGLDGKQLQYLPGGRLNNVDIRYGFTLGGAPTDLVVASNRTDNSLAVYSVDPGTRALRPAGSIKTGMKLIYGLCMYRSAKTQRYFVFVNSEKGEVQQWELGETSGSVTGTRVRSFSVGSQTEGCVADDDAGFLYIGEEKKGIWKYGAEPDAGNNRTPVDSMKPSGHLSPDVEGLSIYYGQGAKGYLLASSQGDNTFAVYDREGKNAYIGSFQVTASSTVDAVTGTDGIDVLNASLGGTFGNGIFVAQDTANDGANQNFKLVKWDDIAQRMVPPLAVEPARTPRP